MPILPSNSTLVDCNAEEGWCKGWKVVIRSIKIILLKLNKTRAKKSSISFVIALFSWSLFTQFLIMSLEYRRRKITFCANHIRLPDIYNSTNIARSEWFLIHFAESIIPIDLAWI